MSLVNIGTVQYVTPDQDIQQIYQFVLGRLQCKPSAFPVLSTNLTQFDKV